jgi:hypothetical protein
LYRKFYGKFRGNFKSKNGVSFIFLIRHGRPENEGGAPDQQPAEAPAAQAPLRIPEEAGDLGDGLQRRGGQRAGIRVDSVKPFRPKFTDEKTLFWSNLSL